MQMMKVETHTLGICSLEENCAQNKQSNSCIPLHCASLLDFLACNNTPVCSPDSQVCSRLIWVKQLTGMVTFIIHWHVSDGGSGFR